MLSVKRSRSRCCSCCCHALLYLVIHKGGGRRQRRTKRTGQEGRKHELATDGQLLLRDMQEVYKYVGVKTKERKKKEALLAYLGGGGVDLVPMHASHEAARTTASRARLQLEQQACGGVDKVWGRRVCMRISQERAHRKLKANKNEEREGRHNHFAGVAGRKTPGFRSGAHRLAPSSFPPVAHNTTRSPLCLCAGLETRHHARGTIMPLV